ncbi:cytochrome P450 71A1-like [Iris pallida]|uniref:Cytochrome P450 71A1-like n=1 Tax=Iris pallida TaxID=29817 RepID=A0AAX6FZN5_IRIPA|nr:cytochrome P450 71A1-like [Iris pallida]
MLLLSTLIFLLSFSFFFTWWRRNKCTARRNLLLPPSPPRLPLLGNLHQLGSLPHRSLAALAESYGPLMLVHLGCVPTVVVSSAEVAREVMKTHDLAFASRPAMSTAKKLLYDCDVGFAPYGEYWRQARRVCVLHLLTSKRVQSFRSVRDEEASRLVERIRAAAADSAPVNLSKTIRAHTNDVVSRVVFGRRHTSGGATEMFTELTTLVGLFPAKDFVPRLAWLDKASGLDARVERNYEELDRFLERVLEEHRHDSGGDRASDGDGGGRKECANFVDILLSLGDGEDDGSVGMFLSRDNLKAIILDMIVGATDTISTSLEWAMAELVKNPKAMKRAQEEVREAAGGGAKKVAEDDLERTEYLKAVIKETLRLHPPLPLLIPRETTKEVVLRGGYEIPSGTRVVVNAWAIGRDPRSWEEPEGFFPDRFLLDCSVDFRGHDFGLIPFGLGRRGCPGVELAAVTLEVTLAHLLHVFDWALPGGMKGELLDIAESPGLTVHKKSDLILVPICRNSG